MAVGRRIVSVSLPPDVADWIDTHWHDQNVSGHIVDLLRITMKGAAGMIPAPREPADFSKLPFNQRLAYAISTCTPLKEDFMSGLIGQADFFAKVGIVSKKLNLDPNTVVAALPGGLRK